MKTINRKPPLHRSIKQSPNSSNTLRKSKSVSNMTDLKEKISFVRSKSVPNMCGEFLMTNSTCILVDIVSHHDNMNHPASAAIEDILTSHVYGLIIQTVISQLFRLI